MTQLTDLERFIVANPGVDRARLERVRALRSELLAKGLVQRPQYRLVEPFATRRIRGTETVTSDKDYRPRYRL
jgi:hypothetical protein